MRRQFSLGTLALAFFLQPAIGLAGEATGPALSVEHRILEVEFSVVLKQYEKIFTAYREAYSECRRMENARANAKGKKGQAEFDEEEKKVSELLSNLHALEDEQMRIRQELLGYEKSLNATGAQPEPKK
jgi:hypothetical protein